MLSGQGAYSFPLTWNATQSDLSATGGLALGGFEVENTNCYPSFTATLSSITSTGATIEFTPLQSSTSTVLMQF